MTTETVVAHEYRAVLLYLNAETHFLEKYNLPVLARNEHSARDIARRIFDILYPKLGDIVDLRITEVAEVQP